MDQKEGEIKFKIAEQARKAVFSRSERAKQNAMRARAQFERELEWYLSKRAGSDQGEAAGDKPQEG